MEDTFKILCPYCNAAYTAKMEEEIEFESGCDSCSYGRGGDISIICTNCKKVVYKKEV